MSLLNKTYSQRIQGSLGTTEVRRTVSFQTKSGSISGCSSSMSLCDMMEPPDWEELASKLISDRDPMAYPPNDVEVLTIPRRIRTIKHVLPEEDLSEASLHVRDCVRCYTSDWIAIDYHYRPFSGSFFSRDKQNDRIANLHALPRQQYEIDFDPLLISTPTEEMTIVQSESQPSSGRQSVSSISSSSSCNDTLTPRGSWASLDLRSSSSDPLLPDILERKPPDQLDQLNEARRMESRHKDLLGLFLSYLDDEDAVERRMPAEMPCELMGHRLLVHCHQLKLELDVEPIFASIALYDARERKKVSENFYFNLNSDSIRHMLTSHVPHSDVSTMSRSAIFDILHPSPDLFFVIRLEKVLQGDINECIEPYIKDDKNREKVRAAAMLACDRLGKYRMPFAWTAISIMNVLNGSPNTEKDHVSNSDKDSLNSSSQSNSLDRKASTSSLEQLKRRAGEVGGSLTRRGSLERRMHGPNLSGTPHASHPAANPYDEVAAALDSFKAIGITVTSFFKQEPDKMKDDDLYKFLQEIKRPSSVLKKLKCIPAVLKVEIMPCPDEVKNGLTPELAKLHPYGDEKARPVKEILPFPIQPILLPHYQYRNLLYVCPKDLNFTAFTSRTGSARNIAVRIQLMSGEQQSQALFAIFGKSSCPEFTNEAYTTVTYHNKCPSFYDEIKLKLPANLGDQHHLFFTFYHISCQKKPVTAPENEKTIETPLGYTWLPLCRSGRLSSGEYNLPVMIEDPPPNYSYIFPDVLLPGTKWIDNHKAIFTISLDPFSSVHPMDGQIERFVMACEAIQEGNIPARIGLVNMEAEFRASIIELPNANPEALVKNLTVVLDRLVSLLLIPPVLNNQQLNVAQDVFMCINQIFTNVSNINDGSTCDNHGRSPLLSSYVQYQCLIPKPHSFEGGDNHDGACKILHEEICLQWVVASGATRDSAMLNSWTLFEVMVKSMVEQLGWNSMLDAARKNRFSDQYIDDLTMLVSNVTSEIISRYEKDGRLTQSLNNGLAFFLFDLLSIMDRGFVFGLVRTYYKQMSAKISSLPDAVPLILNKIAFLRIMCSHEHFAALNLPSGTPYTAAVSGLQSSGSGAPASPSPSSHSVHSTHSVHSHRSDTSYQMSGPDRGSFSELSADFKHQHFLVGLLLSELASVLDLQSPMLQGKAAGAVLSVLGSHDGDPRWTRPELRARLAALYIPLLTIIMDAYPQLYRGFHTNKDRQHLSEDFNIIEAQQGGIASPDFEFKQLPRAALNSETTRNLLMCVVWVLRWADRTSLQRWCGELPPQRMHTLLMLLGLCYACFEYKGKKEIQKCTQQNVRKTTDIKTKLEDVILGQGSARSELIMRRKGMTGDRRQERWRKDWQRGSNTPNSLVGNGSQATSSQASSVSTTVVAQHPTATSQIEGALSAEVSLTVLHTLETIVQVVSSWDSQHGIFNTVLRVLLLGMEKNQSTTLLQHMFATLRSLILKCLVAEAEEAEEVRLATCAALLRHCGALAGAARAHAAAALYQLMRQNYHVGNNFTRVKMQVTMSLSSLVGTSATFNEDSLRRALKTILTYAERDADLAETTFPEQVKDLVFNLHMILSDTVKMKEFQEDPEMLLDLMHRIAKGYQNSPDLRLTWLNNMAQKHMERSNHTEAGMCLVHGAALALEGAAAGGTPSCGAQALLHLSWNVLEEALTTDAPALGLPAQHFTNHTLQGLLEHAASELQTAGMYEAVSSVYKVLIPIAETNKDYKKLANIYGKLNEAYTRIDQLQGKRVFGTYFRVGFYGSKFGDLNGEEFIYKEPTLTKLPEIFSRLENFYGQRFGVDNVVIIKDSNSVDISGLDSDKAYIQITYVEPYFEPYELRHRTTIFERNFNIKRFIYATPFTMSGRAHGELYEQYKRKTILTTAQFFPYVKTRIQVVSRDQVVLSPIEVAIEDIQKKINELAAATSQDPPDPKILQMVVQGCIGTTVNQGPLEMAQVFLGAVADGKQPPTKLTNKLRLCFKDFSKKCHDALKKNKNLIGPDQREYQRELERNYQRFTERLAPLIQMTPGYVTQLNNVTPKTEWKYQT